MTIIITLHILAAVIGAIIGSALAGPSFDRLTRSTRRKADRIRAELEMKDGIRRSRNCLVG